MVYDGYNLFYNGYLVLDGNITANGRTIQRDFGEDEGKRLTPELLWKHFERPNPWYMGRPYLVMKKDMTMVIRWFETPKAMQDAMDVSDCIIGCFNPLIYKGENIFRKEVKSSALDGGHLLCDPALRTEGITTKTMHFNTSNMYGRWWQTTSRTFLGYRNTDDSFFLVVCGDRDSSKMALPVCADILSDLGCYWGVNLDGGALA